MNLNPFRMFPDPLWYHLNVKPMRFEYPIPDIRGMVKGLYGNSKPKMSFLEWSRMIRQYEKNPMLYKGEKIDIVITTGEKSMPMSDGELQVIESLFRDPYEPGIAVVKEVRRLKEVVEQYRKSWVRSNETLNKAYDEINELKSLLDQEKAKPKLKGLPTEYDVAEASLLIQKLAEGIRYVEQTPNPYSTFNFPWKYRGSNVFNTSVNPPNPVPSFVNVTVKG